MASLNTLLLVLHHIVTQVVEAHFVVCAVGDICGIGFFSLCIFFFVNYKTYGETHETVNLAHPFAVTACKIIIDGNDMNTFARKTVEICGKGCNESFTFTRSHFGNSSLMKNDTADNLHGEMLHAEHAPRCLAAGGKCFGENIIKSFAVCKTLSEFGSFRLKLFVGKTGIFLFKVKHLVAKRTDALDFFLGIVAEDFFQKTHITPLV